MKKSYETHENEYRRMERKGIKSWFSRNQSWEIDPYDEHFLEDFLAQPWAVKKGTALDLGCGTGCISRWLTKHKFKTTGVDISKTAVRMARKQSRGWKIDFRTADICTNTVRSLGRFNVCVDGRFFHAITNPKDRKAVLKNVFHLLEPKGVFILMSMCSPVERTILARNYPAQKILKNIIYYPLRGTAAFSDATTISGEAHVPMRYLGHWKSILSELTEAGLRPTLVRLNRCVPEEPVSSLNVAAIKTSDRYFRPGVIR